jgi:hypothetical protein
MVTGAVFLVGFDRITGAQYASLPLIAFVLVAYFAGMVLSRVGSLLIEPVLQRINFVKYAPYSDFIKAEKTDEKISTLLETNNAYRTFAAAFLLLAGIKIAVAIGDKHPDVKAYIEWSWPFILTILFALAYRKQTQFIYNRVEFSNRKHGG